MKLDIQLPDLPFSSWILTLAKAYGPSPVIFEHENVSCKGLYLQSDLAE